MKDFLCHHYPRQSDCGLYADSCGYQSFENNLLFLPPRIETVSLLHFVVKGKGTLTIDKEAFPLKEGDLFYCPIGVPVTYHSSQDDPYTYYWITFGGKDGEKWLHDCGFSRQTPVLQPFSPLEVQRRMQSLCENPPSSKKVLSELFAILDCCKREEREPDPRDRYAEKTLDFLRSNYADPSLRIVHAAQSLHLSPEYLSKVFRERFGKTAKQALTELRLSCAARLLQNGCRVQEAAEQSGYDDFALFSRSFKKTYGLSPRTYRDSSLS